MDDNSAVTVDAPAIVCDLTTAPDTAEERMAEYHRLFTAALAGRERAGKGVRLLFRADEGVEAWVRDLAAREKACCAFYDFAVGVGGGHVWWSIGLVEGVDADEHTARTLLDTYYYAPDYAADGVAGVTRWLAGEGFAVTTADESGTRMRFEPTRTMQQDGRRCCGGGDRGC